MSDESRLNPYSAPRASGSETVREISDEVAVLPHDIVLAGSMSIKDVLRTQLLILRKRWLFAVLTLSIYLAFVITLGLFTPSDGSVFGNTFLLLGLVVMPAILPLTLLMVFIRLRRDSNQKTGVFAVTESRLTNDGIHSSMNEDKDVTIEWSAFSRFLVSKRVVLLFLESSNDHLIIARSKLVDERDWPILIRFLSTKLTAM